MTTTYVKELLARSAETDFLSVDEALNLYYHAPLPALMNSANMLRNSMNTPGNVTWIVDRNVNITNICQVQCLFCNFCTKKGSSNAYTLTLNDYHERIETLFREGGNQLLLQGGLNPELGLRFYTHLFASLKDKYPNLKLHALGPPEIVFLSKKEGIGIADTLKILIEAGLDSLPGAGAEILSDRVRKQLSPAKCSVDEWLEVMRQAHKIGITTTATMMFGHIETIEERIQHLYLIRELQNEKPPQSMGFIAFIPWPCSFNNTRLLKHYPDLKPISASEYVRFISLSRIFLRNIQHIQASWLTVGTEVGALCLHAGADDLGSVMIEENVVKSTGLENTLIAAQMKQLIRQNGFIPVQRDQNYNAVAVTTEN
ncbi:MAG: CofH family radical SAM protein [Bacteroidales bacterium]|nr:CofH family radical SAM protein [Bacteroidales bacterium]HOY38976.1 CofH family radical SAM protein [Bacteroidales bacterium]HQP04560.1 CofH family radical SAM protein [Bacteroidales bacterium]